MGNDRQVGHQSQIPGKSVTDLLAQVILRVAGPEPNTPYARTHSRDDPYEEDDLDHEEVEYDWVYEDEEASPATFDSDDHDERAGDEDSDEEGNDVDDTDRGRRRDDNDLFRI